MRLAATAVLLAAAALTITVQAQADETRFDRAFDAAIEAAAPRFRPYPPAPSVRPREYGYREWRTDGATVSVRYFLRESPNAASKLLRERMLMLSVPTTPIGGYGEESYLVAPGRTTCRLWFRHGAVMVEVTAPELDTLRRVATLFAVAASLQP